VYFSYFSVALQTVSIELKIFCFANIHNQLIVGYSSFITLDGYAIPLVNFNICNTGIVDPFDAGWFVKESFSCLIEHPETFCQPFS
jgi:hypothetical protein